MQFNHLAQHMGSCIHSFYLAFSLSRTIYTHMDIEKMYKNH